MLPPLFLAFLVIYDMIKEKVGDIVAYSKKNIDQYLRMYPYVQKWVSSCPLCGARGRKPETPDSIGSANGEIAAQNLKRMLPVLEVDEDGFCLTCSRLYHKPK